MLPGDFDLAASAPSQGDAVARDLFAALKTLARGKAAKEIDARIQLEAAKVEDNFNAKFAKLADNVQNQHDNVNVELDFLSQGECATD